MTYVTATADRLSSRRGVASSETITLVFAALALTVGAAAWIADAQQAAPLATAALSAGSDISSFDDRFLSASVPKSVVDNAALPSLDQPASWADEMKLREAKDLLAQQLTSQDWRSAFVDDTGPSAPADTKASALADIPLPRSRPVAADLESRPGAAVAQAENATQPDNRTLLQKLTDLLPGRVTLASLAPDGGLFRDGPDLGSLGYDSFTAVYDISARAVYLPNGPKLEAHSGFGGRMDDPGHVNEPNVGATPPAVYELKPRERLFHGVRALRMIPVDNNTTLGRSGLLAHSYMLGPNGDSNGCVSIKNYDRFLKAFDNGEIKRLVVVPSLNDSISASRRSTSQS